MKVSLNEAKMWATPNTCSPSRTVGPSVTFSSFGSLVFFLPDYQKKTQMLSFIHKKKKTIIRSKTKVLLHNPIDWSQKKSEDLAIYTGIKGEEKWYWIENDK